MLEKRASQQSAKKRKRYTNFSDTDRAEIGRYAAEYENATAQWHFKAKFPDLGGSTVRSFKTKYLATIARGETVSKIPSKKTGRPLTLGEMDGDVQNYVKSLRATGTPILVPIVLAAAEGIVRAMNRTLLAEHGDSVDLNRSWAVSLVSRIGYTRRKATTQAKHQVTQD